MPYFKPALLIQVQSIDNWQIKIYIVFREKVFAIIMATTPMLPGAKGRKWGWRSLRRPWSWKTPRSGRTAAERGRLIYQVYEVDPLKCPNCGRQMKIIAFIREREEIIRILRHLKMWPIAFPKPAAVEARASPLNINLLRKLSD